MAAGDGVPPLVIAFVNRAVSSCASRSACATASTPVAIVRASPSPAFDVALWVMNKTTTHDWERIELDYRAGLLTLREMATMHGITHGAINKRAKRDGWSRDLSAKIHARAAELVSRAATVSDPVSIERLEAEQLHVEVGATAIMQIKLGHQGSSRRGVDLGMKLMSELEAQSADIEALEQLGEIMAKPDPRTGQDKLNEASRKAISLASRAGTYKTIVDGLRIAIALQRQAFDMDTAVASKDSLADRLRALSAMAVPPHADCLSDS